MGILLLLLLWDECVEVAEFEDTVDDEDLEVAQFEFLFRGGVGGGTGLVGFKFEQSLELRFGDKREGKLKVFVHWAKLRTIFKDFVCLFLISSIFVFFLFCLTLISKNFNKIISLTV